MTLTRRKTFKDYFLAFFPPVAWAGAIFVLSSQEVLPGFDLSIVDFIFKKTAHMFVYAVLYFLLYRAFSLTNSKKMQKNTWIQALVVCFLYAITDELHQATVVNRYATLRDIGYDVLGMSLVFLKKFRYI